MADSVLNAPQGFEWIKGLNRWRLDNNHLMVDAQVSNGGEVTVMFSCVSERIWRMQLAPDGDPLPELAALTGGSTSLPLQVIEDTDRLIAKGA